MAAFTSVAAVREYLNSVANAGQFTDGIIGSNIVVASNALQRMTNRQFELQSNTTKVFSSHGRSQISIPDLATASDVTLNSASLSVDSTYYLVPDAMQTGSFTAIDLPQYRDRFDYRSYPDWFDKNYDSPLNQRRLASGIPNDLSITGTWGYATIPPEVAFATKVLAAWYTKRPDAVLSNTIQTPEGNVLDLSRMPPEVQGFITQWRIGVDEVVTL